MAVCGVPLAMRTLCEARGPNMNRGDGAEHLKFTE